ncbi:unnamed protein product [Schistosoma curassoni]|uniref:Usp domain-containing protein n=1 Tax=Schistosoma curassoni TaxID=6186 RepID=A0A183L0S1_9TREM|nr:unnamed protein product [Schistosoma curassoni]
MVVGSSQHETLDPGFVLLGTRQQGVPVLFLRELTPVTDSVPCHSASESETLPLSCSGRD